MTTAPALDARPHATAIKAAVKAQIGLWEVYDYDEVPGGADTSNVASRTAPLPPQYALVSVERRYAPTLRQGVALASRSSWRVTVRGVGTTVDEARWMLHRIDRALDGAQLAVSGLLSSPLEFELAQTPEPDEGRFSGRTQYVYTI